jgi:hypothetical protein
VTHMLAVDLLRDLTKTRLKSIARFFGLKANETNEVEKKELVHELSAAYQFGGLSHHLKQLDQTERDLLTFLSLLTPAHARGINTTKAATMSDYFRPDQRRELDTLIKRGLVFSLKNYWNEILMVPDEVYDFLLISELSRMMEQRKTDSYAVGKVQIRENNGLAAHHDLLTVLAAIAHEKVAVTQQGRFYKTAKKKISGQFRLEKALDPYDDDEENIDFWQNYLQRMKLIQTGGHLVRVNLPELEKLLAAPYESWSHTFCDFYLSQIENPDFGFPLNLCLMLFVMTGSEWESRNKTLELISTWNAKWGLIVTDDDLDDLFYHPLTLFGLVETGTDSRHRSVWRWTDWGKQFIQSVRGDRPEHAPDLLAEDVYFQPNLEIMVPENILPAIRWQIETFAELKSADTMLIFEWSQTRLEQAVEAGWTFAGIQQFIQRCSKNPIPENVLQTIKGWTDDFGKAKLWDVYVLELKDKAAAAAARSDKSLRKLMIGSFSDTAFVIRRRDEPRVRALMAGLGFPILQSIFSPDLPEERQKVDKDSTAIETNRKTYAPDALSDAAFDQEKIRTAQLELEPAEVEEPDDDYFF